MDFKCLTTEFELAKEFKDQSIKVFWPKKEKNFTIFFLPIGRYGYKKSVILR
jgi:hypothetical protein